MEYRRLGRTNLQVSCIGFGGAPMGINNYLEPYNAEHRRRDVIAAIHKAIDLGINLIDTAPAYGQGLGESIIGEAIENHRNQVYLATKVSAGLDYQGVLNSVDESLRRLNTDYIDILQFHGGYLTEEDYLHLVQQGPLDALKDCQKAGKIRYIGITNEEPDHILLWAIRSNHFDMIQVRYNLFYQSAADPIIPEAAKHDVGVAVMRPLTSQSLHRLMSRIMPNSRNEVDTYQIALDFVLSNPDVTSAICGMRAVEEVIRNVESVMKKEWRWDFHLDRAQGGVQFTDQSDMSLIKTFKS